MTRPSNVTRLCAPLIRAIGNGIAGRAEGDRRLCILNYHRILSRPDPLLESEPTVDTFRWQMDLLASSFNVLPLHEAVTRLASASMPPRAVAITFDDGYRSTYDLALPLLKERGLPATVFVTTAHMNDDSSMWNDIILEAVRRMPPTELDLRDIGLGLYPLQTPAQRKLTAAELTERCKYLPPAERQHMLVKLESLFDGNLRQEQMLTPQMIRTLSRNGVEIGGHTVSHPILACLDDAAARREIIENKRQLEAVTGEPARLFAYPNGKKDADFDLRHVQMVSDAGYEAAFTTAAGAATRHHDRYQFPRSRPWDGNPLMFAARLLSWLRQDQR